MLAIIDMSGLSSVLVSAGAAFGVALGTLWLAKRAGLTSVQIAVSQEEARLVAALKDRVTLLEDDGARKDMRIAQLEAELASLERRYLRLERDYERLLAKVEKTDANS